MVTLIGFSPNTNVIMYVSLFPFQIQFVLTIYLFFSYTGIVVCVIYILGLIMLSLKVIRSVYFCIYFSPVGYVVSEYILFSLLLLLFSILQSLLLFSFIILNYFL